ncbi:hypothetical protein [Lentzea guizhouensis]|uniref:hypothetical protein n=1 Tax=Lentzea guizhouensis TaxID=1586287 RepID=UPI000AA2DC01|nr:hypothetical protein [Lentzea guizhouensis]
MRTVTGNFDILRSVAEIVLVHGIAQEQRSADVLESTWLPALAGGVRTAGNPERADQIWRDSRPGNARMAFYGDLFRRADQQGGAANLQSAEQQALYDAVLAAVLANAAARSTDDRDRREAEQVLATNLPGKQGVPAMARPLLNALLRIGPFARLGISAAERLLGALKQVSLYLTDDELRATAQQRVLDLIGPVTRVVIAHSLGTVVAYETLHRLDRPLPLFITSARRWACAPSSTNAFVRNRRPCPRSCRAGSTPPTVTTSSPPTLISPAVSPAPTVCWKATGPSTTAANHTRPPIT